MENYKQEIINRLNKISGKYSVYEVFSDWIKCSSIAISNYITLVHDKTWKDREQDYIATIGKYSEGERKLFEEMLGLLALALEEKQEDVLGWIYMASGIGSKAAGQFFTPYHVSELCAELTLPKADERGKYKIYEPSCGGGGMIIATASALRKQGVNYQVDLEVVAQDLDWKGVYMCYLQLSLLGIKAVCVQGDTLKETYTGNYPKERVLYTPAKRGVLW